MAHGAVKQAIVSMTRATHSLPGMLILLQAVPQYQTGCYHIESPVLHNYNHHLHIVRVSGNYFAATYYMERGNCFEYIDLTVSKA